MITFESMQFKENLIEALKAWTKKLSFSVGDGYDFFLDLYEEGSSNYLDELEYDEEITFGYKIKIELPSCEYPISISCGNFIELIEELKNTKLHNNSECRSNKRFMIRVEPISDNAIRFFYHALPEAESAQGKQERDALVELNIKANILQKTIDKLEKNDPVRSELFAEWIKINESKPETYPYDEIRTERFLIQETVVDGKKISCSLARGFTLFSVLIALSENYDENFPPILDEDLFVELRYEEFLDKSLEKSVLEAYLFELSSSLDISFGFAPRPYLDNGWIHEVSENLLQSPRSRPLMLGRGLTDLLELYNKAVSSRALDVQILYFTKVIEYVSQTVIRIQSNEAIRAKLLSPKALQPDASFISELETVVERQKKFKSDREAIQQTIVTCCEASELAKVVPPSQKQLKRISVNSESRAKEDALKAFGRSLYATRNQIAHAKANYQETGSECPKEDLNEFVICAKIAAEQVIRWYHTSPEHIRII